jgi:two-component system response regulator
MAKQNRSNDSIILVVEDNEDDEALAVRGFQTHAPTAQICVARNGQEAIDCLAGTLLINGLRVKATPHFVLLDLKLPLVSGFGVLKAIREHDVTKLIPVVVFSSSDAVVEVRESYELGANTYIQKPIDFDEYLQTIGDVARYWFTRATIA